MREKRRFIRFNIALQVAYIVQKDPKIEKIGITRDISAQGMQLLINDKLEPGDKIDLGAQSMQLLINDKLEPGDKIDLKIFVPGALNPAHIKGVIVWLKESDAAKSHPYCAGIDFEKIEEDNKNTFLKFLCSLMYTEDKKEE